MNGLPCRFAAGFQPWRLLKILHCPCADHGRALSDKLLWHIRLCNKLNFLRSGCWLLLCRVKPTDTVEQCSHQTPRQTGQWVARQINYSVNCQLSSTADIPFHFHFTSLSPVVWKTAAPIPQPLITPPPTPQPHSHSPRPALTGPLSGSPLILLFSIVSLGPLFRMRWQPR